MRPAGHELHVLKGSFPFVGEPIRLETSVRHGTLLRFPQRIAETRADADAPVRISKIQDRELQIVAESGLTADGSKMKVTTVDGRQYLFNLVPAHGDRARVPVVMAIEGAVKPVSEIVQFSGRNSQHIAERLLSALEGQAHDDLKHLDKYNDTLFLSTPRLQATIQDSFADSGYVAHRLLVKNLSDSVQTLRESDFKSPGTVAVRIKSALLQARPMGISSDDQSLTDHLATVFVVVRR